MVQTVEVSCQGMGPEPSAPQLNIVPEEEDTHVKPRLTPSKDKQPSGSMELRSSDADPTKQSHTTPRKKESYVEAIRQGMPPAPDPTSELEDIPTTTTLLSKDTGSGYSKTTKQQGFHRQDRLKNETPISEASVLIKSTSSLEQQLVVMENTKQRLDTILSRTAPMTLTISPQDSVSKQLPLATTTSTYSTEGTYQAASVTLATFHYSLLVTSYNNNGNK